MPEFKKWESIPRDIGEVVTISEKLDGANMCIIIEENKIVGVQSRTQFITSKKDCYGFAKWVVDNEEDLLSLGDGYHYGEWVGPGIRKNKYMLTEKRFFLFNTLKWNKNNPNRPFCCYVVPVLYIGKEPDAVRLAMYKLKETGSQIEVGVGYNGYVEGVIAWYNKTRRYTKTTYEYENGKWADK